MGRTEVIETKMLPISLSPSHVYVIACLANVCRYSLLFVVVVIVAVVVKLNGVVSPI